MSLISVQLHEIFNSLKRYHYPFNDSFKEILLNGIYIKFENGETYKDFDRIVRIGTDTGQNQLQSRLKQHFEIENHRRSIFRHNIGRSILNKENSDYLKKWDLPFTSSEEKKRNLSLLDFEFEKKIEQKVSRYIQSNFSFCVIEINTKSERLFWESKLISTIAQTKDIKASQNWLGNYSPKKTIRDFGLWQIQAIKKVPMNENEFIEFKKLAG